MVSMKDGEKNKLVSVCSSQAANQLLFRFQTRNTMVHVVDQGGTEITVTHWHQTFFSAG